MPNIVTMHFPLILFVLLLPCFSAFCLARRIPTTNITTDQLALLSLKSHIISDSDHQVLSKNWTLGSPVCDWIGVTCGSRHHRVTALDLSGMKLTGTIPPQLGNLSFLVSLNMKGNHFNGELPDQFSKFRRLKVLDFTDNNLNGDFPPWIGSFQKLEYLSLWNNSFTGIIPTSISNMSKLTTLYVGYNDLRGNLPTEIFNMSALEIVSLGVNGFTASSLPENMCQNLPRLKLLDLEQMGLIGRIPSSIGECSQLQSLYMGFNSLTGVIPKQIGELKGLEVLALGRNWLEGAIPEEIGNLSMLQIVDFGQNNLTGVIPEEMGKLSNLQQINFHLNKLTGSIPVDIFNISTLMSIDFGGNILHGNLPITMGYTLPNLENFYLDRNHIGGVIPNSISNCSNLQILELAENNFTGPIPNSLGDLRLLRILDLPHNNFTNDPSSPILNIFTTLTNCKYLKQINVGDNPLDGTLPHSIGNFSSTLEYFYANKCKLKGTVPEGIGNLSSLVTLSLYDNQLIGSFPASIENLQNLQIADLGGNRMRISLELFCDCKNLGLLDLHDNSVIGGAIPDCLGNITTLRYLYLNSTGLNSSIPVSFWNLKHLLKLDLSSNSLSGSLPLEISYLKSATSMAFSKNYFSGEIPSTIVSLEGLQNLSLAHNKFQGHIPEEMDKMLSLNILDLSYNLLSGAIPKSLEKLQGLIFFNVSFNNLSGEIPSRGPFKNMTAESFISNRGLCGAQKYHVQPCSNHSTHHRMSSKNMRTVVIVLAVTISVASITCLGFIFLKCKKSGITSNDDPEGFPSITPRRISYDELLRATNRYNQSNLLGTGSFGSVYKGTLDNGKIVAVKVFNMQSEGSLKSFDTECEYLHCGYTTTIVHCDLKPSNVLLDQEMVAHITDFGISKLLGMEDSITYTNTLATLCYVAPEYASEGLVSTRCDIYSFGIMMMEVFTKKSPSDEMFGETLSLKRWVQESMPDGLANVIDANLLLTFNEHYPKILDIIVSIMDVALTCTNVYPRERKDIEEVLGSLIKIRLKLLPYLPMANQGLKKSRPNLTKVRFS
ncbi:OLC1v1025436C1 [Oldenlandia corymbosa var. corymbosa]|uniref:non-specific serine/threonine protein kinase n=1 Tax=Oldenlandia corymbosa var. corymbosa TaxID=529605 RepID=A0AAV1C4T9_OLDCO|nr:OLC1v1025436C1 [Oldenlandia corymbosa var. corymbosa]